MENKPSPLNHRHPGPRLGRPLLPDARQYEMFGGGSVVGTYPVAGAATDGLLLAGHILGAGLLQ